ncbi:transporter substrate-binding domain-containing protein [Desulfovibrio ferrophilus]|uniref:ABC transporter substrate-binding protein n=1 Tax=Desulfovibrio ferrophilus TaxID=241368 RepID=A0A2Z6B073_9BACT|nr:transporter substrate-binding domain-containing protein [Desulfovibrio ferrophilus]BBD08927.1 ABC transporter substrate-binding protein [Desulfovibrio ferrophilus]
MPKAKRLITALVLVLTLLVCVTVAQAANTGMKLTEESTLTKIMERGVLRVGFDTFVPWAMKDKTGKFIGFEIDVARRFAQDMGVKIELVPTAWKGIIPALLAGKFDLLIGGMSIRADRAQQVYFSLPYYYSGQSLVANKKLAAGFDSIEDFNSPDVTIAVRTGTTAQKAAQRFFPKAKKKLFDKEPQALQDLLMGRAHAFVSMAPLPAQEAVKNADKLFIPLKNNLTNEPNGICMRKGDPDMLNYVNSWILAVQGENWIQDRYHYWFETMDWKSQVE